MIGAATAFAPRPELARYDSILVDWRTPIFGTKAASYDPLKFNWLGTPSFEVAIASVWHKTPVDSWLDTRTHEITMGSSGVNSTPSFYGRLLTETLGMKQKIIVGYESQTHAFLAMASLPDAVETDIDRATLASASEVFLTSAVRGMLPVRAIGDRHYAAGPVVRALQAAWTTAGMPSLRPAEQP